MEKKIWHLAFIIFFFFSPGLTLQAKAYLKGQREGKAILYKAGSYPYGAIAPVQFLWQAPLPKSPASENGESASTRHNVTKLWVWCHPAAQKQVLSELMNAIDLYNQTNEVASENDLFSSQSRVSIASRNLIRFRLIGPRSHALLMETLKPAWNDGHIPPEAGTEHENVSDSEICRTSSSDYDFDSEDDSFMINEGISLPPAVKWWSGELEPALDVHFNALAANYQAIRSAPGPAHFSRGAVIGLCVQDPRLYMPSKKTDMVSSHYPRKPRGVHAFSNSLSVEEEEEEEEEVPSSQDDDERDVNNYHQSNGVVGSGTSSSVSFSMLNDLPVEISFSSLWDVSLCDSLSKSKIPDHLLNRKRSEKLIKSPVLNLGDSAPRIPVLLIQQTLKASKLSQPTNGSLGVGWDLILPQNWAMAFWVSLIYRGARACGMEELQKCGFESQVLDFPCDFPDTDAGEQYNSEQKKELERQYMLKPPDKRLNYGKLLVSAPFHFPWEELVRYWSKRHRIGFDLGGKKRPLESFEVDVPHKKSKLEVNGEIYEHKSSSSSDDSLETMINTESTDISASHRFYVLRSREVLSSLNQLITSIFPSRNPFSSLKSLTANDILQSAIQKYDIDSKHLTSLVAVRVEVVRSGTISCLDSLSLPSPTDLRCFLSSSFPRSFSGPEEEINQRGLTFVGKKLVFSGISSLSRKGMKEVKKRKKGEYESRLGRSHWLLRRCSVIIKWEIFVGYIDPLYNYVFCFRITKSNFPWSGTTSSTDSYCSNTSYEAMPLISGTFDPEMLIKDFQLHPLRPSRLTIGRVTSAGYRLTSSTSCGLGFVTFGGLVQTVLNCHSSGVPNLLCLARGTRSKYYFVKLNLIG